ncbi:MAG: hypothetical protein ACKVHP_12685 [Verrucomicrobiales bacterium]|jgi:hypothetical protein
MIAQILTHVEQTVFGPGETVGGEVRWSLDQVPKSAKLQLFYYIEGKGTRDVELHAKEKFATPLAQNARPFPFQLPKAPWSFSGKLVSVRWALELIIDASPKDDVVRLDLVVSPTGEEIDILVNDSPSGLEHKKPWLRSNR